MLHCKEIHLVFKGLAEFRRIYLQRFIHKHVVKTAVGSPVSADDKLIFVLSEIQAADNPVQFILSLNRLADGAADFIHKVVFKMLHRRLGLFCRRFPVMLKVIAAQRIEQLVVCRIILCAG